MAGNVNGIPDTLIPPVAVVGDAGLRIGGLLLKGAELFGRAGMGATKNTKRDDDNGECFHGSLLAKRNKRTRADKSREI
jgi:hypothetical protein